MSGHGRFIVFEGLDGCGKTTQLLRLQDALQRNGVACCTQREPGDGPVGKLIRQALQKKVNLHEESLALLFAADRYEHVHNDVQPRLCRGVHVLCDRYVFSNLAYQHTALPLETIVAYNRANIAACMPDLTVFIDTAPEECLRRITAARAQAERYETLDYLRRIRQNFDTAFACLQVENSLAYVNGNTDEEQVFAQIWRHVQPLLLP